MKDTFSRVSKAILLFAGSSRGFVPDAFFHPSEPGFPLEGQYQLKNVSMPFTVYSFFFDIQNK